MSGSGDAPRPRPVSPCVGVCQLDPRTGWCTGCGRTGEEIAQWLFMDATARESVWQALETRPWRGAR